MASFYLAWTTPLPIAYHLAAIFIALLVIYAHRSNIQRLIDGNENRFEKVRILHRWLENR